MNWNRGFTDLIRKGRTTHWGNWTLDRSIRVGAVGLVNPDTGDFTLVSEQLPGLVSSRRQATSQWRMASAKVKRSENDTIFSAAVVDPQTGALIKAGTEVKWEFAQSGSIASEFAISAESHLQHLARLTEPHTFDWLKRQAAGVGMSTQLGIAQGFGVITSVIEADSGLNVGANERSASFALAGSVDGIQGLLGSAGGKGAFASVRQNKSLDQHLWPHRSGNVAREPVPVAYTFASFEGGLLIPNWTHRLGAFQLTFNNRIGTTYITQITLDYDTPRGPRQHAFSLSGGLSKIIGDIPLDARNLRASVRFRDGSRSDTYEFSWPNPLGQWSSGRREVQLIGVWPGKTQALDLEA